MPPGAVPKADPGRRSGASPRIGPPPAVTVGRWARAAPAQVAARGPAGRVARAGPAGTRAVQGPYQGRAGALPFQVLLSWLRGFLSAQGVIGRSPSVTVTVLVWPVAERSVTLTVSPGL